MSQALRPRGVAEREWHGPHQYGLHQRRELHQPQQHQEGNMTEGIYNMYLGGHFQGVGGQRQRHGLQPHEVQQLAERGESRRR